MCQNLTTVKLYSKYKDKLNRVFIVIERFANFNGDDLNTKDTTLRLLNVQDEKTNAVSIDEFNTWCNNGVLTQFS